MIEGYKMVLGDKEYTIPALSLKQVRTMKDELANLRAAHGGDPDALNNGLMVVLAAMQRNYPDMTLDLLEDVIDLDNYKSVVLAVMGQSGMIERKPAQGEIPA